MSDVVSVAANRITSPRERILLAARDLFHRQGIRRVGVEAIAEAAGTNKMTLYRHFDSKDNLIVAYLRGVASEADAAWREIERKNPGDGRAQLRSWRGLAAVGLASDERGWAIATGAGAEAGDGHPARALHRELKVCP